MLLRGAAARDGETDDQECGGATEHESVRNRKRVTPVGDGYAATRSKLLAETCCGP